MKKIKWPMVIVIIVGVLFGARWFFLGGDSQAGPMTPIYERIVKAERGDLEVLVSANGVVAPINKVEIKSKASGQIVRMPVEEGDFIRQGGLIAELDQTVARTELEQARADLMLAEANLQQAENNLKRATELFQRELISAEEMDRVRVDHIRMQSQLVRAKASLQLAEERMDETIVRAPVSGILLTKDVEVGQIISSGVTTVGGGTLIATLADMEYVHIKANVDEVDIGKVKPGQTARIVADAYPGRPFVGEVIRVAPQGRTEQNITTFRVTVLVKNEGGLLKSGMSTDVEMEIARSRNVVIVPNDALLDPSVIRQEDTMAVRGNSNQQGMRERMPQSNQSAVRNQQQRPISGNELDRGSDRPNNRRAVMVRQDDKQEYRMVTIGINNFDFTEVLDGLEEGEEIVVRTISRARQAGLEWQQRMQSQRGFSGFGR